MIQTGLINTYSTLNLGDAAIYSALAALVPAGTVKAVFRDPTPERIPGLQIVPHLGHCDVRVSVGGDIFNNPRPRLITKQFLLNLGQLIRDPGRTMLFGQSIPRSCRGLSFGLLSQTLKRLAAVCVRDQESLTRLTQAGVAATLSFDAAFALENSPAGIQVAQSRMEAMGIRPNQAALVSLRGFDALYPQDEALFLSQMATLCRLLRERGHIPVILIQSRVSSADQDLAMIEQLQAQVEGIKVLDPFAAEIPAWQVAMGALSLCRMAVGVRYHTAVLMLAAGRIPFNLYYSNKGEDLSRRLGIPGCRLADWDPAIHLAALEQTADQSFDHLRIREQVKQSFIHCYQRAQG